ncbi:hypothetical protein [Flammeovirga pacifica]|uniref:Uncharacterized protein n=1 Tax=Flammeovirga pacifica TaxID=915059 RepID=A0A1S1YTK5_FLAPC|nr:hypothetical protein [Flammeovirga pacifica]OHX64135.1 hypothetical protein NH26_21255 [Flammeovirga pacifica]
MLIETTHGQDFSSKVKDKLVGPSLPFIKTIFSSIKSDAFYILSSNLPIGFDAEIRSKMDYAKIQFRSQGVIIDIKIKVKTFQWLIPYYQLALYQTEYLSIHAQGYYLRFNDLSPKHYQFWNKLGKEKLNYLSKFDYLN